ncbi:hypothetical protein [Thalassoporum mexicanum]|uniref:hypothetical protein n=1 Tax=Thalassoporum mexicanum TaxID=3457544 RepID=UPI0030DAD0BD
MLVQKPNTRKVQNSQSPTEKTIEPLRETMRFSWFTTGSRKIAAPITKILTNPQLVQGKTLNYMKANIQRIPPINQDRSIACNSRRISSA